jgi:hypothetical protein
MGESIGTNEEGSSEPIEWKGISIPILRDEAGTFITVCS